MPKAAHLHTVSYVLNSGFTIARQAGSLALFKRIAVKRGFRPSRRSWSTKKPSFQDLVMSGQIEQWKRTKKRLLRFTIHAGMSGLQSLIPNHLRVVFARPSSGSARSLASKA